jgi:hypothetical protein
MRDEASTTAFLTALEAIASRINAATFAFDNPDGSRRGFVQFLAGPDESLKIHRLWVLHPGIGHGSQILTSICDLADQHGVKIVLKTVPFGGKPYPMPRESLAAWYRRHGFEGPRWKLARKPGALR